MIIHYPVPDVIAIFILGYTFPFYPSNSPKNENFKTMKKNPGNIIILHKCTKNHDQMLYCSWDMACVGCNCDFSFWAICSSFTPLTAPQNRNLNKMKKTPADIIILHNCTKNYYHMLYCSWDIWCEMDVIVIFYFGLFFAVLLP